MRQIRPRSGIDAVVRIPGSKSVTHRALIAAALAQGESILESPLLCRDTLYTIEGLRRLGASVVMGEERLLVSGAGGSLSGTPGTQEIYLGDSGTSYRLLLPIAALSPKECLFTGTPRMHQRPVGHLVRALRDLGVTALCTAEEGYPPVLVKSRGIPGGGVKIRGDISSQFISSLLLSGPYARKDMEIETTGDLVSRPYVDITLDVMAHFGVSVGQDGYRYFKVRAGSGYRATQIRIEGDCSSASYFWAAAAVTGGRIVTENIHPFRTRQGDLAFLGVMEDMGCRVELGNDSASVEGRGLRGTDADMKDMPDMVPTLAAMAVFAEGKTVIRNAAHLRNKESDRLEAIAREFHRLGAGVEVHADGLTVHGGRTLKGAVLDTHNDHRIAMSLAVVGLRIPGVVITGEGCVEKSFPQFWDLWEAI